jgi:hypothetical protein
VPRLALDALVAGATGQATQSTEAAAAAKQEDDLDSSWEDESDGSGEGGRDEGSVAAPTLSRTRSALRRRKRKQRALSARRAAEERIQTSRVDVGRGVNVLQGRYAVSLLSETQRASHLFHHNARPALHRTLFSARNGWVKRRFSHVSAQVRISLATMVAPSVALTARVRPGVARVSEYSSSGSACEVELTDLQYVVELSPAQRHALAQRAAAEWARKRSASEFFDAFGTHVVAQNLWGGRVVFSSARAEELKETSLRFLAAEGADAWFHGDERIEYQESGMTRDFQYPPGRQFAFLSAEADPIWSLFESSPATRDDVARALDAYMRQGLEAQLASVAFAVFEAGFPHRRVVPVSVAGELELRLVSAAAAPVATTASSSSPHPRRRAVSVSERPSPATSPMPLEHKGSLSARGRLQRSRAQRAFAAPGGRLLMDPVGGVEGARGVRGNDSDCEGEGEREGEGESDEKRGDDSEDEEEEEEEETAVGASPFALFHFESAVPPSRIRLGFPAAASAAAVSFLGARRSWSLRVLPACEAATGDALQWGFARAGDAPGAFIDWSSLQTLDDVCVCSREGRGWAIDGGAVYFATEANRAAWARFRVCFFAAAPA